MVGKKVEADRFLESFEMVYSFDRLDYAFSCQIKGIDGEIRIDENTLTKKVHEIINLENKKIEITIDSTLFHPLSENQELIELQDVVMGYDRKKLNWSIINYTRK